MKSPLLRSLIAIALCVSGTLNVSAASQAEPQVEKLAAAVPVLHMLSTELLKDTGIESVYLPPKRLPISRIGNWLQKKSADTIRTKGPFSVLVTMESVWPADALYTRLREDNIRVVAIDAARELLPGGARIRLAEGDIKQQRYFWLAPDNLTVMSQIMARDMEKLWPQQAETLRRNQRAMQQTIQRYALKLDQLLMDSEIDSLCLKEPALAPLAQSTFLLVDSAGSCSEDALILSRGSIKKASEANHWRIDTAVKPVKGGLKSWLDTNLKQLQVAVAD